MRVVINAQVPRDGTWGGVTQFVLGLIHGLGQLDGPDEYVIVGHPHEYKWLEPYLGQNQRLVPAPRSLSLFLEPIKRLLGPLRPYAGTVLDSTWRFASNRLRPGSTNRPFHSFFDSLGPDVVHFPYQIFVPTFAPAIFNPHDLLHLHYPQFFSKGSILRRESVYRPACRAAAAVAVDSVWAKGDIHQHYGTDPVKILAIPMGSPTELYENVTEHTLTLVRDKFGLSRTFAFYPAQTWGHKNHLRLLDALALLRDQNMLHVDLVCTGRPGSVWSEIKKRVTMLGLQQHVHLLGFVDARELRALYHLAQFVIFPSLFEGGGLPILEAFQEDAPVACSNVTSLPEYAGDAALLFDPSSVESIANALHRMMTDAALREDLRQRGHTRSCLYTWERTAKTYRALYRRIAGAPLPDEDRALLAAALG